MYYKSINNLEQSILQSKIELIISYTIEAAYPKHISPDQKW